MGNAAYQSLADRRRAIGILPQSSRNILLDLPDDGLDLSNAHLQEHCLDAEFDTPEQKMSGTNKLDVNKSVIQIQSRNEALLKRGRKHNGRSVKYKVGTVGETLAKRGQGHLDTQHGCLLLKPSDDTRNPNGLYCTS